MKQKLLPLAGLTAAVALALAGSYAVVLQAGPPADFPPAGPGFQVEVFGPDWVLAGRVSVTESGILGLELGRSEATGLALRRALAEARALRELPLKGEMQVADGRIASIGRVGPGDTRYGWAVLDFLRSRGLECGIKTAAAAAP